MFSGQQLLTQVRAGSDAVLPPGPLRAWLGHGLRNMGDSACEATCDLLHPKVWASLCSICLLFFNNVRGPWSHRWCPTFTALKTPRPPGKPVGSELAAPHAVVTCFQMVG